MDVGVEFNQYLVIEHIGRGGMADVWSARDKRLSRTVAIKTIVRDMSQDTEPIKLFEQEAKTIAQLEHPHILPIYDFGEYEGQLYIVMRYVTGGSLESLLTGGPLGIQDVLRHGRAIAEALDYAHAGNVVHLDLKPSNILMDSNSSAYLADFGLAAVLGPEGRAANPGYGTLLYMAPEQLTSSVIDHRADIYSFCILMFQMLTGEPPFDATTSLALKQIQLQEDLPALDKLSEELGEIVTPILRRGTALSPTDRPDTLVEIIDELEAALANKAFIAAPVMEGMRESAAADVPVTVNIREAGVSEVGQEMAEQREAQDIYNKARRAWANGQGRFLLGVTHFMLMNDYYRRADELGLELDEAGMQMLLRGALEYDHDIDQWWNKLDDPNRRWVALHAIRSGSAPARTRALYRLETLPDSDPPKIPTLVAQTLQVESNEEAKLAALQVLGTRAQRTPGTSGTYAAVQIPNGFTGRLLTAQTRLGIQLMAPDTWRPVVYNNEIDTLLAEIALDRGFPRAAEYAARTIGRIRSLEAVKSIAEAQRNGTDGALRALALVRDEAPSLPPVVSDQARLYAWLDNTWRRMTDNPLHNVWRFVLALIGASAAMGLYVFATFRSEAIFDAERAGKTISVGLTFGMFMAFLALLAGEFPTRLRGFWPGWARLVVSGAIGFLWGTLTWGAFTWFFLNYPPSWDVMAYAGFGTALGFVLTAMFNLPGWAAFLLTAVSTYIPLYIFLQFFNSGLMPLPLPLSADVLNNPASILYFDDPNQMYSLGIPVVLLIALGGHAQAIARDIRKLVRRVR
jgi:serine/threonine-protein kinase